MLGAPSKGGRGAPSHPVGPEPSTDVQIDEFLECSCCCESEFLITDMSTCCEGHLFCKECIRRYAENEIGDAKTKFKCLDGECSEEFSLSVLQGILSERLFKKVVQMKQMKEVFAAQIEGFETCPFCEFGSIPDPEDKIFHCQNPDCMKESCRQCHEMSHIPLRCDEVEKDNEMEARKNIEDRMTKVLVRECWQCKTKFVKIDGCNKMVCTCGAKMCYICRQPIKDYNHFTVHNHRGKCPLWSNNDELHVTAVVEEGQRALRDLQTEDPTLNLKHDPTKVLPQPASQGQQGRGPNVLLNDNPLLVNNAQAIGQLDNHFNQHMNDLARGMQRFGVNIALLDERLRLELAPMQAQAEAMRQQAAVYRQIAAEQRQRAQIEAEEVRQQAQQARAQAARERARVHSRNQLQAQQALLLAQGNQRHAQLQAQHAQLRAQQAQLQAQQRARLHAQHAQREAQLLAQRVRAQTMAQQAVILNKTFYNK